MQNAIQHECHPEEYMREARRSLGGNSEEYIQTLPSFKDEYQTWYSEAKALVRQLLPDRLSDFVRYYEKPKPRKYVSFQNYMIEDYLDGLVDGMGDVIRGSSDAAITRFDQQVSIVKSIRRRLKSSLFDIHRLAQADLFDSQLDAARELARNKFNRAAGVVAGVVLERHMKEVCINHGLKFRKKTLQIGDLNDALKDANVIDIPQWRFIQHLGDLRNLCAHDKKDEPTIDQVEDLLAGADKVTKTIF